jgi:DNA-directed RNA polymerase specialized sigma24 family protein
MEEAQTDVGAEDPGFELVEERLAMDRAWRCLDRSERKCLHLRHVEGLTCREIADLMGFSASQAVRVVERSSKRASSTLRACECGNPA